MPARIVLKKPPKYRAKHCWLTPDGVIHTTKPDGPAEHFHSLKECRRWLELEVLEASGEISDLGRRVEFPLCAPSKEGPVVIGTYEPDSFYRERGEQVWEDVKALDRKTRKHRTTKLYEWKKKHVEAQYGIVIREV